MSRSTGAECTPQASWSCSVAHRHLGAAANTRRGSRGTNSAAVEPGSPPACPAQGDREDAEHPCRFSRKRYYRRQGTLYSRSEAAPAPRSARHPAFLWIISQLGRFRKFTWLLTSGYVCSSQQYRGRSSPLHSFEQKVIARTAFPHCCAICVQNSHGSRRTCEAEHCPTTLSLLPYSSSFSLSSASSFAFW